ncbi:hypothetical protein [Vibrio profundi]|uniref:hypothetical protein n=1 Tax=Vibrio profundi TaxID=1774960 RepID=UPI003736FA80
MRYSNAQQRKHAFWSIMLTGLVVLTCLASTLASSSSFASSNLSALPAAQEQQIQNLYQQVFTVSDAVKPLPGKEACSLSKQLLTFASPKLDWLAAFVVLSIVTYSLIPQAISRKRFERHQFPIPKQRLHVTYCIFRE